MASNLLTPILEGGIRSTNFFNGRLLSGEDLSQEQSANRDARRQLGKALGDGVAYGFEVTKSSEGTATEPIISVSPGLAVNRKGQTLTLPTKTDISLVRTLESNDSERKTFMDCRPTNPDIYVAGPGAYVLLIGPARGSEGRAPMSGVGNVPASCNTKYSIDGVQFRLLKLDLSDQDLSDTVGLRNRLAYKCFGIDDASYSDWIANPFGDHDASYGLLDGLRPRILTDCDVPLALLYWTSTGGIVFIDTWAVRRRVTPPGSNEEWPPQATARRIREGEAMFHQFQGHILDLMGGTTNLGLFKAAQQFDYLPALGIIPFAVPRSVSAFSLEFFKGLTISKPVFIEGARLSDLIHRSFSFPPIDLKSMEVSWLYIVRENSEAIENQEADGPKGYLVIANGHIPFAGAAHFDLSRWDYSNYSSQLLH